MAAVDWIATSRNAEFSGRVLAIAFKTAQNVMSEDPGVEYDAERKAYASRVIRGDEHQQMIAMHVISSNPSIQATIDADPTKFGSNVPDGDIEFALASIWTARSLAFKV